VDPFNCAVDPENTWAADKKAAERTAAGMVQEAQAQRVPAMALAASLRARTAQLAVLAAGVAVIVPKKEWCCKVHGKGCPNQGGGCVTSSKPYDCNAGFANWQAGWSVAKKAWCCSNEGKGCPPAAGGCA